MKDEQKKEAIQKAIIQQINEVGFVSVSMSKIAKSAGVSASTLYIYYENKEDMFQKVYSEVKQAMLIACSNNLTSDQPVKKMIMKFCQNILSFIQDNNDYFNFLEQAGTSPVMTPLSVRKDLAKRGKPVYDVFEKGISEGILKKTDANLLISFCMYPIAQIYKESSMTNVDFDVVFKMCWDAIKA
ncbi:TetR/AcrR family transcriptional regulator [Companilactobacillus jidongensis]|uniref:TetR/AcrR family transcriptional regulator n=1 Tax=Companilactobacillus jidongensis TaxID=2486006 RepID=UPI0013DE2AEE|nr:TetR/AcrR family transcriptional regulator [Companilactobacillus jidongensis]